MRFAAKLIHPSTLILIAANLLPLAGIYFWNWDTFLLLILYWMETAIIGFWTILALAAAPLLVAGPVANRTSRFFLVPFFLLHSGIFMGVHFLFLWTLFPGTWANRIHGIAGFIQSIVMDTGLWIPLAALFVSRGISFFFQFAGVLFLPAWLVSSSAAPDPSAGGDNPLSDGRLLGGFYSRIVVMHLTILFGAMVAIALGSVGPLVMMVALKIAIDLKLHFRNDFPQPKAVAATTV